VREIATCAPPLSGWGDESVGNLDGPAADCKPLRIEAHGVQGDGARDHEMPGRKVLRRGALRHRALFAGSQRSRDDLRVVERLQVRRLHGVEDGIATRQQMRPSMSRLTRAPVDARQRPRLAAPFVDTEQTPTGRRGEGDGAVVTPRRAAETLHADVLRQRRDREHRAAVERHLPQLVPDEKRQPATVRREHREQAAFRSGNDSAGGIRQHPAEQRPLRARPIRDALAVWRDRDCRLLDAEVERLPQCDRRAHGSFAWRRREPRVDESTADERTSEGRRDQPGASARRREW